MNMSKNKTIIIIAILVVGIALISIGLIMNKNPNNLPTNSPSKPSSEGLLGEDRVEAQDKIIKVIEKYLKNDTEIKEYLNQKGTRSLSMQELKEELKIDISEFEKLEYMCNNNFTTIDYNEDYSEYVISLTCDALF